ncbi:hypothetical protein BJF78_00605 [Pseudonocardia sp. CNS-139]|nr:hypothetical protein BJF78_00605 [Pseudonocardia sp. CNS-139]
MFTGISTAPMREAPNQLSTIGSELSISIATESPWPTPSWCSPFAYPTERSATCANVALSPAIVKPGRSPDSSARRSITVLNGTRSSGCHAYRASLQSRSATWGSGVDSGIQTVLLLDREQ